MTKAPGVYITFEMEKIPDEGSGHTLLEDLGAGDETKDDRDQTAARIKAYERGEWEFIGICAVAHITHRTQRYSTRHTIKSCGLWGVESDSSAEHISDVYEHEKEELRALFKALGNAVFE